MADQSWIVYSLLSALFLAVVNIVELYCLVKLPVDEEPSRRVELSR